MEKAKNKANSTEAVDTDGDPEENFFGTPSDTAISADLPPANMVCDYNAEESIGFHVHKSKTGSGVESDEGAEMTDVFIGPMAKDPDKTVIEKQSKTGAPEEGNEKVKEKK